jgi:hypothetical protein
MAYFLPMPPNLVAWKITIHDKERLEEEPHVSVIKGGCKWRISLETGEYLDLEKPGCTMHKQIRKIIEKEENWELLIEKWNEMYPNNKVGGEEDAD